MSGIYMELLQLFFALFMIFQESSSVTVTLEDGKTGFVEKQLLIIRAYELQCNAAPTYTGLDKRIKLDWLYYKDMKKDQNGTYIFGKNSEVNERFRGKVFRGNGLNIIVKGLDYSDAGHYRCRVHIPQDEPPVDSAVYDVSVSKDGSTVRFYCNYPEGNRIIPGTSAKFDCHENEPKFDPPMTYEWYKNDEKLPASSASNPRYASSDFSIDSVTGILNFHVVSESDYGDYFCVGTTSDGQQSQCFPTVISGPTAVNVSCDIPEEFHLGSNAELTCRMTGGATNVSSYKWYKQGDLPMKSQMNDSIRLKYFRNSKFTVDSSTGTLKFEPLTTGDVGRYHCEAETDRGTVPCWPKHYFQHHLGISKYPRDNMIVPGTRAKFSCPMTQFEGHPNVKYTWYKDGREMPTSSADDSLYINSDFSINAATGFLTIHNVSEFDYGEYYCEVSTSEFNTIYNNPTIIVGPRAASRSYDDPSMALRSVIEPKSDVKTSSSRNLTPCIASEIVLVVFAFLVTSLLVAINPGTE